jgi:hypothetical protein
MGKKELIAKGLNKLINKIMISFKKKQAMNAIVATHMELYMVQPIHRGNHVICHVLKILMRRAVAQMRILFIK